MGRKAKKTKISSLIVYEDEIKVNGHTRRLVFNNRALGYAEQYCRQNGFELSGEELLDEVSRGVFRAIFAVLYGTVKAGHKGYTFSQFKSEFKIDGLVIYTEKIAKGLSEYLFEKRELPDGITLEADEKSSDIVGDYFELARKVLKMTDDEILNSSLRIIEQRLKFSLGIDEQDSKAGYIDSVPGF